MPKISRADRRYLEAENKKWPATMKRVPEDQIPRDESVVPRARQPIEVWRSNEFLAQIFAAPDGAERISVIRAHHDGKNWKQNITWEEMQRIKSECGRGDRDAVEIYPADKDVVNVANLRHIFVLPQPFPLTWRNRLPTEPV